jgi:predicted patatin/cPLA2 family phospholipase
MRTIFVVETFDGQIHRTPQDARRYLEKKLGDILLPLAHKLTKAEKYTRIVDILAAETETFRSIIQIQDDIQEDIQEEEE